MKPSTVKSWDYIVGLWKPVHVSGIRQNLGIVQYYVGGVFGDHMGSMAATADEIPLKSHFGNGG